MENILQKIVDAKREELEITKKNNPLDVMYEEFKNTKIKKISFANALKKKGVNIIAEIKKASPSKGDLRADLDVAEYAKIYEKAGASAISVLTEKNFFKGDIEYLKKVKKIVNIPALRKDFIIDAYQIFESRFQGADAILLIASILSDEELVEFIELARNLELDVLLEAHNEQELQRVLQTKANIIGINNRCLQDFSVDIQTTVRLSKILLKSKDKILVSESGINTHEDIVYLRKFNVNAFLIGEVILKSENPLNKLKSLIGDKDED
ncbi:indole-3-glycerol phosphate synthase TrpC [bacterium]